MYSPSSERSIRREHFGKLNQAILLLEGRKWTTEKERERERERNT